MDDQLMKELRCAIQQAIETLQDLVGASYPSSKHRIEHLGQVCCDFEAGVQKCWVTYQTLDQEKDRYLSKNDLIQQLLQSNKAIHDELVRGNQSIHDKLVEGNKHILDKMGEESRLGRSGRDVLTEKIGEGFSAMRTDVAATRSDFKDVTDKMTNLETYAYSLSQAFKSVKGRIEKPDPKSTISSQVQALESQLVQLNSEFQAAKETFSTSSQVKAVYTGIQHIDRSSSTVADCVKKMEQSFRELNGRKFSTSSQTDSLHAGVRRVEDISTTVAGRVEKIEQSFRELNGRQVRTSSPAESLHAGVRRVEELSNTVVDHVCKMEQSFRELNGRKFSTSSQTESLRAGVRRVEESSTTVADRVEQIEKSLQRKAKSEELSELITSAFVSDMSNKLEGIATKLDGLSLHPKAPVHAPLPSHEPGLPSESAFLQTPEHMADQDPLSKTNPSETCQIWEVGCNVTQHILGSLRPVDVSDCGAYHMFKLALMMLGDPNEPEIGGHVEYYLRYGVDGFKEDDWVCLRRICDDQLMEAIGVSGPCPYCLQGSHEFCLRIHRRADGKADIDAITMKPYAKGTGL